MSGVSDEEVWRRLWAGSEDPDTVLVAVIDDTPPPIQRSSDPPVIWNPRTAVVEVPKKTGWCDECWDVHRRDYCPEDVLEEQFRLLEERAGGAHTPEEE